MWVFILIIIVIVIIGVTSKSKADKNDSSVDCDTDKILDEYLDHKASVFTSHSRKIETKNNDSINFAVKGLIYRDKSIQEKAKFLEVGDELRFEHEANNEYDEFAMRVVTLDDLFIGYVDAEYSEFVFINQDKITSCFITKISSDEIPFIYANAYFQYGTKDKPEWLSTRITTNRSIALEKCPELSMAERLKYSDPLKAVQIFLKCAEKIGDNVYPYHQACICYRNVKDYDNEQIIIEKIFLIFGDEMDDYGREIYNTRLRNVQKMKLNRDKRIKK